MKFIRNVLFFLVLMAVLAAPVFAAGGQVALVPSAETVRPGDTFVVEAVLENTDAIAMGTVALRYDEQVFEMTGGACLVEGTLLGSVFPAEKVGTFFLLLPKKISGAVFTFEFRVKDNADPKIYEITAEASVGEDTGSSINVQSARIQVACKHSPGKEWYSNQEGHWHICAACGEQTDAAAHSFQADGSCKLCAYVAASAPEDDPTTTPSSQPSGDTQPPETTQNETQSQTTPLPSQTECLPESAQPSTGENPDESENPIRWLVVALLAAGCAAGGCVFLRKYKAPQ